MQECVCKSQKNINKALQVFHENVKKIEAEAINPMFKSKYAKLPEILSVIKPTLKDAGLLLRHYQDFHPVNHQIYEATLVTHVDSGEFYQDNRYIINEKQTNLGHGAGETYARRYAISNILGIAVGEENDDDGNAEELYRIKVDMFEKLIRDNAPGIEHSLQEKFKYKKMREVGDEGLFNIACYVIERLGLKIKEFKEYSGAK